MAELLSEEQIAEFKNAYKTFSKNDETPLANADLGTVIRFLGYFPSEADVAKMIEEYDSEGMGWIDIADFYKLMAKQIKEPVVTEEEIRSAFRVFDKESNGFISATELRHVLMGIGEPLTEEEMEELVRNAEVDGDGQVNYEEFVTRMLSKQPA